MNPWYALKNEALFLARELCLSDEDDDLSVGTQPENGDLIVFARRQDDDTLAAFKVNDNDTTKEVYLLHGWTSSGYDLLHIYPNT